jgi:Transposase
MKRKQFTEEQIIGILKEAEAGAVVTELCRKHGMSSATYYAWKAKYGGLEVSEAKRLRALEEENVRGGELNHKRTHRLYCELGLQPLNKTPKRRVKAKLRNDRTPATAPNECRPMGVPSDQLFMVNGVQRANRSATCRTAASCPGSANERVTTLSYDVNSLPATVTDQAGDGSVASTVSTTYDVVGNAVSVDGPLPGADDTSYFRYDAARQRIGQIAPDPDGAGPLVRRAVRTTYDARGRATLVEQGTVADASDGGWNGFSSLQQVARGFDGLDRQTSETTRAGGTVYSVVQKSYVGQRLVGQTIRDCFRLAAQDKPMSMLLHQGDNVDLEDHVATGCERNDIGLRQDRIHRAQAFSDTFVAKVETRCIDDDQMIPRTARNPCRCRKEQGRGLAWWVGQQVRRSPCMRKDRRQGPISPSAVAARR